MCNVYLCVSSSSSRICSGSRRRTGNLSTTENDSNSTTFTLNTIIWCIKTFKIDYFLAVCFKYFFLMVKNDKAPFFLSSCYTMLPLQISFLSISSVALSSKRFSVVCSHFLRSRSILFGLEMLPISAFAISSLYGYCHVMVYASIRNSPHLHSSAPFTTPPPPLRTVSILLWLFVVLSLLLPLNHNRRAMHWRKGETKKQQKKSQHKSRFKRPFSLLSKLRHICKCGLCMCFWHMPY